MNRLTWLHCRRAMSESCERLCQSILDLIRCRDWYGLDEESIVHKGEICEIIHFF